MGGRGSLAGGLAGRDCPGCIREHGSARGPRTDRLGVLTLISHFQHPPLYLEKGGQVNCYLLLLLLGYFVKAEICF